MPSRSRRIEDAARLGLRDLHEVLDDGRAARERSGLSQRQVAEALGWRREKVARLEGGRLLYFSYPDLSAYCGAVGLQARVRVYPQGPALRDIGQLGVSRRFLAVIAAHWRRSLEVGLGIARDQRATDIVLEADGHRVSVEDFTRLRDVQAQFRGALLKWRDSGNERLVVVLASSRANRAALAGVRDLLREDFPLDTRGTLAALRAGRAPIANGIVLI